MFNKKGTEMDIRKRANLYDKLYFTVHFCAETNDGNLLCLLAEDPVLVVGTLKYFQPTCQSSLVLVMLGRLLIARPPFILSN